ncbi:oxaloacetate-decarboxylating malate dehydrogenase [Campylobacter curvus]|uniref:oxaloacetate-decarboxylating malate dehydrogenase n=1 Tax=Campylobacter curvus TaxID=200 RepID=UPI0003634592|nr:oxaloacetate-decarboxylating malate dehydrogenase [Campylobacter curvus]UEB49366.1 oxaloacetate-decarboxylating malate dehydrogenase [Campylobacter curvus]
MQGTGIITLAAILCGLEISKEKLKDQIYVCFGAGTAGAGIVNRVYLEMLQQGVSETEAKSKFYLVDKQGLLFDDMDDLTPEQKSFARKREEFMDPDTLISLAAVVKRVHPTILVGTSTTPHTFTKEIVQEMSKHTARPMIFPLSNPTELAEATANDLIAWSDGKALVATGIPVEPVVYKGVTYEIGQANNALMYPGLGLGVMSVDASLLTDKMISAAAHSLKGMIDTDKLGAALLPPVSRLTQFSQVVAEAVATTAIAQGLNKDKVKDAKTAVLNFRWKPAYEA